MMMPAVPGKVRSCSHVLLGYSLLSYRIIQKWLTLVSKKMWALVWSFFCVSGIYKVSILCGSSGSSDKLQPLLEHKGSPPLHSLALYSLGNAVQSRPCVSWCLWPLWLCLQPSLWCGEEPPCLPEMEQGCAPGCGPALPPVSTSHLIWGPHTAAGPHWSDVSSHLINWWMKNGTKASNVRLQPR